MAESTMSSAVVVAEQPDQSPGTNGLKRHASEDLEPEQEGKRQRISRGKTSPTASDTHTEEDGAHQDNSSTHPGQGEQEQVPDSPVATRPADLPQRKGSAIENDKKRTKRLFGALLGNLNQPGDRTSKRRQEIESRRKAELQRQDDERLEDKKRRLERLAERRRMEQEKVDEENMRIRHANTLNTANFLQTKTEPRLYYRPWELRPNEEDIIESQLKAARIQIDKELEEFDGHQRSDSVPNGRDKAERPGTSHAHDELASDDVGTDQAAKDLANDTVGLANADAHDIQKQEAAPESGVKAIDSPGSNTDDRKEIHGGQQDEMTTDAQVEQAKVDSDLVVGGEEGSVVS